MFPLQSISKIKNMQCLSNSSQNLHFFHKYNLYKKQGLWFKYSFQIQPNVRWFTEKKYFYLFICINRKNLQYTKMNQLSSNISAIIISTFQFFKKKQLFVKVKIYYSDCSVLWIRPLQYYRLTAWSCWVQPLSLTQLTCGCD